MPLACTHTTGLGRGETGVLQLDGPTAFAHPLAGRTLLAGGGRNVDVASDPNDVVEAQVAHRRGGSSPRR